MLCVSKWSGFLCLILGSIVIIVCSYEIVLLPLVLSDGLTPKENNNAKKSNATMLCNLQKLYRIVCNGDSMFFIVAW